jgi:acyl dehydratase
LAKQFPAAFGDVHCFGTIAVEADEIVAFASRFDPQSLHTDPEAAKNGENEVVNVSG